MRASVDVVQPSRICFCSTGFAAILGFGYARFLYAGNHADWAAGKPFPLVAWFGGDVFNALLAMAPIVLPGFLVPVTHWYAENYQVGPVSSVRGGCGAVRGACGEGRRRRRRV